MTKRLFGYAGLLVVWLISPAAKAELYSSIYDVYFGGLRIGEADVDLNLGETDYKISIALRARGLADMFTDFHAQADMQGKIINNRLIPEKQNIEWSDGEENKFSSLLYSEGQPVSYETNSDWVNDRDVVIPLTLKDVGFGSLDPISSMFASVSASPCLVEQTLFDGLRMSKISPLKSDPADPLTCRLHWQPLAGHSRKSTEHAENMSPLKVSYTQVTDNFLAPHKVLVETRYGYVAMLLRTAYNKK